MSRDKMLTLVIQKFGFEDIHTIQFAEAAEQERLNLNELGVLLNKILALPINPEEEWD